MNNELSIEDQKLLTEFLGECWHELIETRNGMYGGRIKECLKCPCTPSFLDLFDWRVVGRLIEKVGGIVFVGYLVDKYGYGVEADMVSNQLAICLAIATYLKENEND